MAQTPRFSKLAQTNWHSLTISETVKKLKTSKQGLTTATAEHRLKQVGKNILPEERKHSWLEILLNQIKSPLVYILFFAGTVSIFLNHLTDAGVIFFAVFINTIFGFWQEYKANQAIEHLQKIVSQEAIVSRDGHKLKIDASLLVPGDVIYLEAGNKVPADCRLFKADNLSVIEASLTGESEPSRKKTQPLKKGVAMADRENMVYMGTLVARGIGLAVVCNTGHNTEIGRITSLIHQAEEDLTPLQLKLIQFSNWLTVMVVSLAFLVFTIGFLNGQNPVDMFIITVALAVAAIPEGLLVSVTIVLTIGMQVILKRKALVRKLLAAETLGSTSIICTDKTGTLTEGKMQVDTIITAQDELKISSFVEQSTLEKVHDLVIKTGVLCNNADVENPEAKMAELKIIGDPTEAALLLAGIQSGYDKHQLEKEYLRIAEIPFSSENKYMATLNRHQQAKHSHVFMKGAPEIVLDKCQRVLINSQKIKLTVNKRKALISQYEKLTKQGLRLLAFAYKTDSKIDQPLENNLDDLVFLGFVALKDPLREEAKQAIQQCLKAGIRPIMITGDHRLTAKAIYEELGIKINHNLVEGQAIDKWDDKTLQTKIKEIDIYARVEPRHKLRIVDAWQANGEVVAMTGDGVNDAPALKAADIGIALGDGSDVTKETADIILLDNNFSVIVAAIRQGRIIFDNIRKIIVYLLADSFSEMILITGSIVLGLPLPILATQILWINLVADGLPNIAMTLEPGEPGIMQDPPRKKEEKIMNREMKILIFIIGIVTDIILLGLFFYLLRHYTDLNYIRTVIFAALGFDSLLYVFSVRTMRKTIFKSNLFQNKYLLGSVFIGLLVMLAAIYLPWLQPIFKTIHIGWLEWSVIISFGIIKILLIEVVKYYFIVRSQIKHVALGS